MIFCLFELRIHSAFNCQVLIVVITDELLLGFRSKLTLIVWHPKLGIKSSLRWWINLSTVEDPQFSIVRGTIADPTTLLVQLVSFTVPILFTLKMPMCHADYISPVSVQSTFCDLVLSSVRSVV